MKSSVNPDLEHSFAERRISELEIRTAFLEDTVEALNTHLASISQEFQLAKQVIQHLHQRLEQLQENGGEGHADIAHEPPPHY